MSDDAKSEAITLTNGQSSALRILVGIKLGLLSSACEQEAITIMEGRDIHPSKVGNLFSQAQLAVNLIIENKMTKAAVIELQTLLAQYNLRHVG